MTAAHGALLGKVERLSLNGWTMDQIFNCKDAYGEGFNVYPQLLRTLEAMPRLTVRAHVHTLEAVPRLTVRAQLYSCTVAHVHTCRVRGC